MNSTIVFRIRKRRANTWKSSSESSQQAYDKIRVILESLSKKSILIWRGIFCKPCNNLSPNCSPQDKASDDIPSIQPVLKNTPSGNVISMTAKPFLYTDRLIKKPGAPAPINGVFGSNVAVFLIIDAAVRSGV